VAHLAYEEIISYVKANLSNGYSAEAIRQSLINGGYPSNIVDYSVSQAVYEMSNNQADSSSSSASPSSSYTENVSASAQNQQFVQYVSQMLIRGYTPDVIKSYLIGLGYPIGYVQSALDDARRPTAEIKHTISFSPTTIIAIFLTFVVLGGVGIFSYKFFLGGSPDKLLDYTITIDISEVKPGEFIAFTDKFANLGTTKSYDVTVEHSIESSATNKIIDRWQETVAIDRLENTNGKRKIAVNVKPGDYILRGLITYEGKKAMAFERFTVTGQGSGGQTGTEVDEPSCVDGIKNQGETKTDCGGPCQPCIDKPTCTDGFRNQDETGIDCGGSCKVCPEEPNCIDKIKNQGETGTDCGGPCPKCMTEQPINLTNKVVINIGDASYDYDKVAKVEQMGKLNENESVQICKSVVQDRKQADCFMKLSTIFNSSKYCRPINISTKRDVCYMYFVNQRDYSVCNEITQPYTKRACTSLQQVNKYYTNSTSGMPTGYAVSGLRSSPSPIVNTTSIESITNGGSSGLNGTFEINNTLVLNDTSILNNS
jgi:hypothetical protein